MPAPQGEGRRPPGTRLTGGLATRVRAPLPRTARSPSLPRVRAASPAAPPRRSEGDANRLLALPTPSHVPAASLAASEPTGVGPNSGPAGGGLSPPEGEHRAGRGPRAGRWRSLYPGLTPLGRASSPTTCPAGWPPGSRLLCSHTGTCTRTRMLARTDTCTHAHGQSSRNQVVSSRVPRLPPSGPGWSAGGKPGRSRRLVQGGTSSEPSPQHGIWVTGHDQVVFRGD